MIRKINGIEYDTDSADVIMYLSYNVKRENYDRFIVYYKDTGGHYFELHQLTQYGRDDTKGATLYNPLDVREISREIHPKTEDEVLDMLLGDEEDYVGFSDFYGRHIIENRGFNDFLEIKKSIMYSFIRKWLEQSNIASLREYGITLLQAILLDYIEYNYDSNWVFSKEALKRYAEMSIKCALGYQEYLEENKVIRDTNSKNDNWQPF